MSRPLISRSPDLQRLRDEGYEISIKAGHLLVEHVPYLNGKKEIKYGTLVSNLSLAGDVTARPEDHQAHFVGEVPCNKDGSPLSKMINSTARRDLGGGVIIDVSFSTKPSSGYADYYEKMTTHVFLLSSPAASVDPSVTAKTGRAAPSEGDDETVFHYLDTASSRAGIGAVSDKLKRHKIGIIGVGGTGSYILDLIAKAPVAEIHLFDDDDFLQHNAFRAPGAPSVDELNQRPKKVEYFAQIYSRMHKKIVPHVSQVTESNVDQLRGLDFVFICMDRGSAKKHAVELLEKSEASFIDVGMGIELTESAQLLGIMRVTTSTPTRDTRIIE